MKISLNQTIVDYWSLLPPHTGMEVTILRFSHLSERIFNLLDNQNLLKCKKVNKSWQDYLDKQKFLEIRKIKATVDQFHTVGETWINVFETASTKTIMDLGLAVKQFYVKGTNLTYFGNFYTSLNYHEGLTPTHVAAGTGQLKLLEAIWKKIKEKDPKDTE